MNIERLPERLLRWTVTVGGILGALFLAKSVCDGRVSFVALVLFLMFALFVTLCMKEKIWVLVPVAWGFSGTIPALAIPFGIKDLVTLWVFAAFFVLAAFKVIRRKPVFGNVDLLVFSMTVYLIITFLRNPVGIEAFGSDRVGGRPYFNVAIGLIGYLILRRSSLGPTSVNAAMTTFTFARILEGVAAQILNWVPALVPFFAAVYHSDFFSAALGDTLPTTGYVETTGRLSYLATIGQPILIYLAAKYPLSALFDPRHPGRMVLFAGGIVCVLFSGFRSLLFLISASFLVAGYLHRGSREVVRLVAVGFFALIFILIANGRLFELPRSAQRALSFLPGKWDEFAILEARESTRWRTEMWDIMLNTNLYVDSHLLGDGFGFKKRDLERITMLQLQGIGASQEDFMITGAVHSGPVSAIRYVGYVGLALHIIFLIALAVLGWKVCKQARNSPYQPLAFLIAIPIILEPGFFIFVFGAFETSFPSSCFALGMLRMLQNSVQDHAAAVQNASLNSPESTIPPLPLRSVPV